MQRPKTFISFTFFLSFFLLSTINPLTLSADSLWENGENILLDYTGFSYSGAYEMFSPFYLDEPSRIDSLTWYGYEYTKRTFAEGDFFYFNSATTALIEFWSGGVPANYDYTVQTNPDLMLRDKFAVSKAALGSITRSGTISDRSYEDTLTMYKYTVEGIDLFSYADSIFYTLGLSLYDGYTYNGISKSTSSEYQIWLQGVRTEESAFTHETLKIKYNSGNTSHTSFYFLLEGEVINPVPEPSTVMLLFSGIIGIALFRKRIRNR